MPITSSVREVLSTDGPSTDGPSTDGLEVNEGLVSWLLDCPERGYFVPVDSESTDEL